MSGYYQSCPYPPVDPKHPEENRCQWRYWVDENSFGPVAERQARVELVKHMNEKHGHKSLSLVDTSNKLKLTAKPQLSLVDTSNKLKLTADQVEVLITGVQVQLAEMSVPAVLDDETLIPLLVELRRMAKEGGTIDVVPF